LLAFVIPLGTLARILVSLKRPFVLVTVLTIAGILLAEYLPPPPFALLATALAFGALAILWNRARPILICGLVVLSGAANLRLHRSILSPNDLRRLLGDRTELGTVRGVLCETPSLRVYERDEKESWRSLAQIDVTAWRPNNQGWLPATGRVAVSTPGILSTNVFGGQIVEVTGVLQPPRIAAAEGTFDYRAYLKQLGIYYALRTEGEQDWSVIASPTKPPLTDRFREWARAALARGLPCEDESLRLEWVLTLGRKTGLTEEVSEPFTRAATYHIFAVDGLRMAIVFGIFFQLFRALRSPRSLAGIILIPLIWGYVALTGWPASAIRATVMLTVVILGWVLKRPSDIMNSLFAAAFLILTWQPQQLFQAGFQLSFLVVLCMILLVTPLDALLQRWISPDPFLPRELLPSWRRILASPGRYFAGLVLTSFAAWIGSLPLVAYYFNLVTPVSTPANVLAVPLCGLTLIANLGSLLLAPWWPGASEIFNHAGWGCMELIRVSSHWFAGWPRAYAYVAAPSLYTSILYYGILVGVLTGWVMAPKLRAAKLTCIGVAILVWAGLEWSEYSLTRLSVLPVSGGLAVFSDAPGTKDDLLVDCGVTNAVQSLTKPFLRAQGINGLPALLLTHGDLRHVGGAELVGNLFAVNQFSASPVRFRSAVYRHIMTDLAQTPDKLRVLNPGDKVGPWTVLHPAPKDKFSQADDNSVVLLGSFGGTRVLLLSDLGQPGQAALLERMPELRADIVVTGLPAASEPVGDAFLDVVRPRLIIVGDSEFPAVERASEKLRDRLASRPVPVIYTRLEGSATIELRSKGWEVRTMSGGKYQGRGGPSKPVQIYGSRVP
jgi:competence protein ComEC